MTRSQVVRQENGFALSNADQYLMLLRWAAVGASILLAFFGEFAGGMWLPFPLALGASVVLNLLLSWYGMRRRAFASGHALLILIADAMQAGLATLLVGGYHSMFFPLFILLVVELAVALPVHLAAAWILSAGALHVAAAVINQAGAWTALGAYMTVGKLFILLIVGALAVAFSEQIRREERSRRSAEEHAAQLTTLNELFFQLNQPRADLTGAFTALLDGAQRLLHAEVGAVLLCDAMLGCWKRSAGFGAEGGLNSPFAIADWGWPIEQHDIYTAGPAYDQSLPPFWVDQDLQAVAGIRLNSPAASAPGALIIGRRGGALSEAEWLLLRALAREAELALRNAQLFAGEHAQVLRLQQFEETRQAFLSAVAHELRTPLTVLKTVLPSLNEWDRVPAAQQQEIMAMVEQNLQRLEALSRDFLESTRLEAGAVTLHRQPLDLARRAAHVMENLRPLWESKGQQVTLEAAADLPRVSGDRRRVDQILSSLLHNAYKFTPTGGAIRCALRREGDALETCIEDNGTGVPLAAREHIFDKFYSASAESALAGVGLGLYICRELVALHGGRLWYEERPGGGSRFCFTLPITAEAQGGKSDAEDSGD
jgi:signal transduction histidine kinase